MSMATDDLARELHNSSEDGARVQWEVASQEFKEVFRKQARKLLSRLDISARDNDNEDVAEAARKGFRS